MASSLRSVVLVVLAVACSSAPRTDFPSGPSSAGGGASPSYERRCPPGVGDCLAWDDFDRAAGPISVDTSGRPWNTFGLSCEGCHPTFGTDGSRATMAPGVGEIFVWLATIDTDHSTGIEVSADVTLSPTPLRANVGLIGLFEDRMNHLTCKLEVTEGHPEGLLTIGEQRNGETTSLLAERDGVGLRNGKTYQLTLTIPRSPADRPVRCDVSGGGIDPARVSLQLTPVSLAAYGEGTAQGLRIKIFDDEDDGGSSWDDFLVRPI